MPDLNHSILTARSVTVLFLNLDIGRARTGIENAALRRATVLESQIGIAPRILTVNYNPFFTETRDELHRLGLISRSAVFENMYDSFQGLHSEDQAMTATPVINASWRCVDVPDTFDMRVYDDEDQFMMYRKCSSSGALEYINYFHERRKWRRDSYTPRGVLSRIQLLDEDTGTAVAEHYLRSDGSIALIQYYSKSAKKRLLVKIQILSQDGQVQHEFKDKESLITHWLKSVLADPQTHYVIISDKNRVFFRPLRRIRESAQNTANMSIVPVIHAVHTKNAQAITTSGTNANYKEILEDIEYPDAIVVATRKQKQDIAARYGAEKLHAIPHSYVKLVTPVDFRSRNRLVVVFLARYSKEKNQAVAIRAFADVLDSIPEAQLHLYGAGPEKQTLQEQIQQLGLQHAIKVNDFIQDAGKVFDSAGLSILTSQGEGFSLVVMESLAHGCPVISFDINYGPSDLIEDGVNGYLVPFGDEELFAKKIISVLRDDRLHESMCDNAFASSSKLDGTSIAQKWRVLIEDLVTVHSSEVDVR
jgi:poly(glycerol-phosphate) alpha-glucosyltransferase